MKTQLVGIGMVAVFITAVVPALAEEGRWLVFVGSDGSVKFQPSAEEMTAYAPTGLSASSEVIKYPEAVKRLIAEKLDFLPVKTKIVHSRMIRFLTWRVTETVELVLARIAGDGLEIRVPISETEQERKEKEMPPPSPPPPSPPPPSPTTP